MYKASASVWVDGPLKKKSNWASIVFWIVLSCDENTEWSNVALLTFIAALLLNLNLRQILIIFTLDV